MARPPGTLVSPRMRTEGAVELEAATLALEAASTARPAAGLLARAVQLVRRAWDSWATRSLAMGAIATPLDILTMLACVKLLGWPNPVGAMVGVVVGCTFAFVANRLVAFTDARGTLREQVVKFILSTSGAMVVHAALVYALADRLGVPLVIAKLSSDFAVFTIGQLFMLRYVVFPRKRAEEAPAPPDAQAAPKRHPG